MSTRWRNVGSSSRCFFGRASTEVATARGTKTVGLRSVSAPALLFRVVRTGKRIAHVDLLSFEDFLLEVVLGSVGMMAMYRGTLNGAKCARA